MQIDRLEVIIEAEAKKANAELDKMIGKLNQVSSALGKTTGFSFGGVTSATTSMQRTLTSSKSLTSQLGRLAAGYYSVRKAVNFMNKSMEKSMDYVETVNLFQTSLKKIGMESAVKMGMEWGSSSADAYANTFIDRAEKFNDMLVDNLTLDPELMKNYQAVFAQMTNSMNLVSDTSMNISETFTMLGNDIASLWNIDTDKAMKKLQSGLAGQIRPLRELGIDISKTSLEMYAMNYGIEDSVEKMSQAAKVQLRYLAIMEQAEVAFGDMAKTIESPSNQLRILSQQWTNLSRSIGNVFLPVATTVLPYINGLVIALRNMTDALATAMGYEVPDYSDSNIYKDLTGDIGDMENVIEDTTDANEKLRKSMMKWDELNILSEGKSKTINFGSGYKELDEAINQKSISYFEKFNDEMQKMSNKAKEIASEIQPKLQAFVDWMDKIAPILKGIGTAFVTYKVITWFGDLASKLALLNPTTGVIALAVGAIVAIYEAVKTYNEKLVDEDLAKRFGDISLKLSEINTIAEVLTTSEYSANIDIFVTENQKLEQIEKDIKADIETLNKLDWKVQVGIGLTEGEIEQYKSTIESFIAHSNEYIDQQQYSVALALKATITNDDAFLAEMTEASNLYFDTTRGEMEALGKKLRETYDLAFADGVLDTKEQELIWNIRKEMTDVMQKAADLEFQAQLKKLAIDYGSTELTAESWEALTKKIQDLNQTRLEGLEEAELVGIQSIMMRYNLRLDEAHTEEERQKITAEMEAEIAKFSEEVSQTEATITLQGVDIQLDALVGNYQEELERVAPKLSKTTKEVLSPAFLSEIENLDSTTAIGQMIFQMTQNFTSGLSESGMDKAAKDGLKEMLKAFKPTIEQLEEKYQEGLETGQRIPDGVSDALTDLNNLKALTGDMDAIAFLLGQKLSTDQTFLDLLATSETAGEDLNDYFIAGMKSKHPDLKKAGKSLVSVTDAAVAKEADTAKKTTIPISAGTIIGGFIKKFTDDTSTKGAIKGWLDGINNTILNYKMDTVKIRAEFFGIDLPGITEPKAPYLRQYATGGYPDMGELFIAREAGPELVGNIGNRPAVASNDQITQGIATAVESAMARVLVPAISSMSSSGGKNTEVAIYLDSDVLARAVNKANQSTDRRFSPVSLY